MKTDKSSMLLYAVTDRTWLKGRSLANAVEEALKAGVTFLQLREKTWISVLSLNLPGILKK